MDFGEFLSEIETIVYSGTKINIDYYIYEILDKDMQDEIFDYFRHSDSDSIEEAFKYFEGEYTEEELRLMRIKFINDLAN